ncbi:hypothetical protein ACOYR1_11940 [Thalassotalea piscium]
MNKTIAFLILCSLSFTQIVCASETIFVVANTSDKSIELSRQQVRNLFMGSVIPYKLKAIALPPNNQTRVLFNTKVVGLTETRIQSYWAQMRFTGRKKPPKEVNNERSLLEYLKENKGTVGYLSTSEDIPSELTILFKIN